MVDDAPAAPPPAYDDLGLGDDDDDEDLERLGLRDAAPAPAAPAAGDGAPPPNQVTRDARDPGLPRALSTPQEFAEQIADQIRQQNQGALATVTAVGERDQGRWVPYSLNGDPRRTLVSLAAP